MYDIVLGLKLKLIFLFFFYSLILVVVYLIYKVMNGGSKSVVIF